MADRSANSILGESRAAVTYRWALLVGFVLMLAANLPGHMTLDSVFQLFEGRTGVRITWAPSFVSWLFGRFDRILPGTSLYVAANAGLLFASLRSLQALRGRTAWTGPILAAIAVLTPTLLLYQGIVWKDVLFANLAVAGFVALAHAAHRWERLRERWALLALAAVLLSSALLVRQNGFAVVPPAILVAGWAARGRGLRSSLVWGIGFGVVLVLLAQVIGGAVQSKGSTSDKDFDLGWRVVQRYDILGALVQDPSLKLDVIAAVSPAGARLLETEGRAVYSPARVDTIGSAPAVGQTFKDVSRPVVNHQWEDIVRNHTAAYLGHRARVFWWVAATPEIDKCLPFTVGVQGPPDLLETLKIPDLVDLQDHRMFAYAHPLTRTPLFSHLAFAGVTFVVLGLLLLRRDPADMAMAGLMAAALLFMASFAPVTVACDYRYLYFVDLAALAGLLYLALDPPGLHRRA